MDTPLIINNCIFKHCLAFINRRLKFGRIRRTQAFFINGFRFRQDIPPETARIAGGVELRKTVRTRMHIRYIVAKKQFADK